MAKPLLGLLLGLALAGPPGAAAAVPIGQIDTFDVDTDGWISGDMIPTSIAPSRSAGGGLDGGPYLSLQSYTHERVGTGPGARN